MNPNGGRECCIHIRPGYSGSFPVSLPGHDPFVQCHQGSSQGWRAPCPPLGHSA
ncbi:hypothetical protein BC834DRAFT_897727 [Gloeopeniophorella convolvens]|nr:hypothetical protein BC834DRAFT_897727 [Gloeopeniophorella convolvens]